MTRQPPFDGKEGPMDLNEAQLKERLDTAVSDVSPDVFALVTAGTSAGRGFQRRRRIQQGLTAVAASALAVGAIAYVGNGHLFGSNATPPADGGPTSVEQLVDATPRGMAAAVMAHIDEGTLVGAAGDHRSSDTVNEISVELGYRIGEQDVEIRAVTSDNLEEWLTDADSCPLEPEVVWCDDSALVDGTPAIQVLMKLSDGQDTTQSDPPSTEPPVSVYSAVTAVKREGQIVVAMEMVRLDVDATYTVADLPISMETLLAIATDPTVGFSTTEEFNEQGEQIADFGNGGGSSGSSSGSGSASPPSVELGDPEKAPALPPANGQEPGQAESSANSSP